MKKLVILYLLIVMVVTVLLAVIFEIRVRPILSEVAISRAKSLAVRVISGAVNDVMASEKIEYTDLVTFQKNGSDNITAVTANIVKINKLKAKLSVEIEKKVSDIDVMSTKIHIGNLFNQSILSGIGPRIKIKMVPVGYADIDVKNEFSSAGINQTKHEIYLEVSCSVSVLLPLNSQSTKVTTRIPVAETIIVGNVPDTYTNIAGEDTSDVALNLVPD